MIRGLDTFTDSDATAITSHTPDLGFGSWFVVGGVYDGIYSNELRSVLNATAPWDLQSQTNLGIFDNFEMHCDIERPNDGTTNALSGILFQGNGISKSASTEFHAFVWERNTGDPDTVNLILREMRLGVNFDDQTVVTGFAWARDVRKRMGVLVVGQKVTPYIEDAGGGNRVTWGEFTFFNNYTDTGHERYGLWTASSSQDNMFFDDLTVKDYTAPSGGAKALVPTMFLGRRDTSADIWRFGVGATDAANGGAGDTIVFQAKTVRFAPAGVGGEAIFTQFWIALTYDMDAITLRFTPIVDGVIYDGTGGNPDLRQTLALTGTVGTRVTERYEFALWFPYDDGTDPDALRVDLRGIWFQLLIDSTTTLGSGDLIIEQPEIEYEIVRESEAAQ